MATQNFSPLYLACYNGDIAMVQRLLQDTKSLEDLNRVEPDGNTCLHVAASRGYKEIIRLLLEKGAYRRVKDRHNRTPLEVTKTEENRKLFSRPAESFERRYGNNPAKQVEWQFKNNCAEAFARAVHWGCMKDRGVKKTIKKIEKAEILNDDGDVSTQIVLDYFKKAREENDPMFLLQAYTTESLFYKQLNSQMATGSDREVYKKLRGKWTGYYTGLIARNRVFDHLRYSGQTYRGMQVTQADYDRYKIGIALSNKSFQSTSKSWKIARGFAFPPEPKPRTIPVVLIFTIKDKRSALSIEEISDFQYEEEVLILPGTFFLVTGINEEQSPHEIQLDQIVWENEF